MNEKQLLKRIKSKARQDQRKRRDVRFLETMGFLVAKGFLNTNFEVCLLPNRRLRIDDAVWAGQNVEPRILEVLPAAVLRLGRHFDLDPERHPALVRILGQLRECQDVGDAFYGVPYDKLKVWASAPLKDARVKAVEEKKVMKTFRLRPEVVLRLRALAREWGCTETDALERGIASL